MLEHLEVARNNYSFTPISGHMIKALEAMVSVMEVEGETLKYEVIAVAEVPNAVRKNLKKNGLPHIDRQEEVKVILRPPE